FSGARSAARRRKRIRTCREPSVEGHISRPAKVAGIERIDPQPLILAAGPEDVTPASDNHRVFELYDGAWKELLRPDICVSNTGDESRSKVERQESGSAIVPTLDSETLGYIS